MFPIVINNVQPEIEGGKYPSKTEIDRPLQIKACAFKESQEQLKVVIKYRFAKNNNWFVTPMKLDKPWDDEWSAQLELTEVGSYLYTIEAWVDKYQSWLQDLKKRIQANTVKEIDLQEGIELVKETYKFSQQNEKFKHYLMLLLNTEDSRNKIDCFLNDELIELMDEFQVKHQLTEYNKELEVWVEPKRARFAAWYEMFPRSANNSEFVHGTFKDCHSRLSYIKDLGFEVIYFPPIHPIGFTNRKGKNNSLIAKLEDPGCPWAIGSSDGGHKAINPELGTIADFEKLVKEADNLGLEIALDFAIQCSPDHPYLQEHPDWFFIRPDGSIKYAENPPKEYQDIYPINFWCEDREALWNELKSIVEFWISKGIKTFRVDNPHTKPFIFWEWLIREIKNKHPEIIFLSEAFTQRNKMYELAKRGFTQSYTYFTWRNSAPELQEYLSEITSSPLNQVFRGNLFANTPDILNEYLQKGSRPAFAIRAILAATLSSVYGIYSGFELCENIPLKEGSEEYLDSEKFQLKHRNWNCDENIKELIKTINQIRLQNKALHFYNNLHFHESNNANILAYGKSSPNQENNILVIVNVDPNNSQEGAVKVNWQKYGLEKENNLKVHDLITNTTYIWNTDWNYVKLEPQNTPAHIFVIEK